MKILLTNIAILFVSLGFAQNLPPQITITNLDHDLANEQIVITYDLLDAENDLCDVFIAISDNEGVTHGLEPMATGDINNDIEPNTGLEIRISDGVFFGSNSKSIQLCAKDDSSYNIEELVAMVDSNRLRSQLEFFQGIRHRTTGAVHLEAIIDSIGNAFENENLEWERLPFNFGRYEANNILGLKRGFNDSNHLLVGGHFDTVDDSPGADDNGSAIVGMLEALRVLNQFNFRKSIKFIGFDLEEEGLVGSIDYTGNQLHPDENLEGYFNFEMIGYFSNRKNSQTLPAGFEILFPNQIAQMAADSFRGNFITAVGNDQNSLTLQQNFEKFGAQYVPELEIIGLTAPGTGVLTPDLLRSDHASFWLSGQPAIMISDGANFRNPNYHSENDVLDSLNFSFMSNVVKATVATIAEMAEPFHGSCDISVIEKMTSVKKLSNSKLEIYPNPVDDELTIKLKMEGKKIDKLIIYDAFGRVVKRQGNINDPNILLSTFEWPSGQYFLQVIVNEEVINLEFMKN